MSKLRNITAGLAGAIALNILHESLKRKSPNMPRIDLLGEDALKKTLQHLDTKIESKDNLYKATLAGDIVSNTLFYSMIGSKNSKFIWSKAVIMGLSAGIGAITLPEHMGLDDKPVAKNKEVKTLTIIYYLFGAMVTATALQLMKKKFDRQH